jgi:hypothetical protein
LIFLLFSYGSAEKILIPMDLKQKNHLKAYGLAYYALEQGIKVEWLLNYRGGSFWLRESEMVKKEAYLRGVSFEVISSSKVASIEREIEKSNMEKVLLEKAPSIAVYSPPETEPWDDAVTLALEYAEIPYTKLWDEEVLRGELAEFDWLHLHHEDFTGQFGKFYGAYRHTDWYQERVRLFQERARKAGFSSVRAHKLAVAREIQRYVIEGGFLFAMCSACDTIDIALAAHKIDIIPPEIDGTPITPQAQQKLDFAQTFAFTDFQLEFSAYVYEFSDIDISHYQKGGPKAEDFVLFDFSAKYDPVPTMLVQCHQSVIKGFLGQTTDFYKKRVKKEVVILAEGKDGERVKYIHGNLGKGTFTFYGGHDPEDYMHLVGEIPTNLALHPNSPGYRLILNNILFPAAKEKPKKT